MINTIIYREKKLEIFSLTVKTNLLHWNTYEVSV